MIQYLTEETVIQTDENRRIATRAAQPRENRTARAVPRTPSRRMLDRIEETIDVITLLGQEISAQNAAQADYVSENPALRALLNQVTAAERQLSSLRDAATARDAEIQQKEQKMIETMNSERLFHLHAQDLFEQQLQEVRLDAARQIADAEMREMRGIEELSREREYSFQMSQQLEMNRMAGEMGCLISRLSRNVSALDLAPLDRNSRMHQ